MSIPERLWRVVRGRWEMAQDRVAEAEAQASAYQELADTLRQAPPVHVPEGPGHTRTLPPSSSRDSGPRDTGRHDPMDACYELLQVPPGADLDAVDTAYQARLAELQPERFPVGSAQRAALDARQAALEAAYDKLRDTLNPTETRFERLEF